jgi:crotonobetainyl-CoA:carnitine CoA-transferase CaiB-like acyl-CoA transferase
VKFFELVGREDMCSDERVLNPSKRSQHIDYLYSIIDELTPTKTTEEWMTLLKARDVPCAYVNKLEDLFDNQHLTEAGLFEHLEHPTEGRMVSVRSPFRVLTKEAGPDEGAPGLGADASRVLAEAGYTSDDIRALIDDNIVGDDASARKAG